MVYQVLENEKGEIYLNEISDVIENTFIIETLPIHYNIWKENYLNKVIKEKENFQIFEEMINEETFHLIALPIVNCKNF